MKRTVLFFISICFLVSYVLAEPVDTIRALQIAKEFVPQSSLAKKAPGKGETTPSSNIVYTHKMPKSGRDAFYIVNVEDAFVLVSADDVAHQILGYSFDKGFPVAADGTVQLPPHVKGFFDDLAAQMEAAIEAEPNRAADDDWTGARKAARRAPSNLPESVDPLITTTWDQGQYYNALCPIDANGPDGHVVTGCVATAMAQIIKYWGEPVHGRGIHSYESNYGTLEVNFAESNYDFSNMPDALTGESTAEQINAVAKLMYDCGVAVNMGYAADESSAFDQETRAGLINYFYFSPDLSFVEKAYFSNEEWSNLLRQNLAASRPVYYSGQGTEIHAFICDGYKTEDYYHFNFGWGGFADGWFLTSAVSPNGRNFNSSQSAIVGIVPDNTGNVILGQMQGISTFVVDEPLEFYHLMGHNKCEGNNYDNSCNSTVTFISDDDSKQIVADIIEFENQTVQIYDGTNTNTSLRGLNGGGDNNLSPVVSSANAITVTYSGNLFYAGFKLNISQNNGYRMVSNITSSVDATTVHLTWTENGGASQWQLEYGFKDFELGTGVVYNTTTNTASFENLEKFTEYDFYIRPVYGNNQYGPWNKVSLMVEAPYWTEVVTEQPEGYFTDDEGNITISSAEGLAWFSKLMASNYEFLKYNVTLVADINLGQYKWKPIKYFSGTFDGQGHRIDSMYVVERGYESTSLFGNIHCATIKNINLINCCSRQLQYQSAAGLVASIYAIPDEFYNDTIMNCYVSGRIEGHGSDVAPIVSFVGNGVIINCASNCVVTGGESRGMFGGIAGDGLNGGGGVIRNCYSASKFLSTAAWQGYVIGYCKNGLVENCYGYIERNGYMPIVNGEMSIWRDNTWFDNTDNGYTLFETLFFEPDNQSYNNLKEALNAGVRKYNIQGLRLWVDDIDGINEGMPLLGPEYKVKCPNIQKLTAENVLGTNSECGVKLSWIETGEALKWEIKYHAQGDTEETRLIVSTNPYTILGLTEQTTYCFSVRPICSSTDIGGWSEEVSIVIDRPYWTDIVTSQPEGYSVDNSGNVTIASAEGLAWLISVTNGLNGEIAESFEDKSIVLTQDIDIGQYKWTAINGFLGVFDAKEHVINGLYVNELSDNQGLFGCVLGGNYLNVVLKNADVRGRNSVGMLIGYSQNISVINCHVSGSVYGEMRVGGLLGYNGYGEIETCSSLGIVVAKYDYAGGLIGIANTCRACSEQARYNIRNSFSRCDVTAGRYTPGGLVGSCTADIYNCYAVGNVNGSLYNGGLIGSFGQPKASPDLNNCYYGGKVSRTGFISVNNCLMGYLFGTIAAHTYGNPEISNCYSLFDGETPYQLIGPPSDVDENCNVLGNPIVSNTVSFTNENNNNTLLENISIGQTSYNDLMDALNAWVNANNSEGQYRHWVVDTENVNGGFPIFAPAYILKYKVDGEIYNTQMVESGAALPAIVEPTKDGYTFGGWEELPETMPDHDVEVMGTFYLYGDVNTDAKVNVVDVVDIARFVVETPSEAFREKLADLNLDLSVNIADAVVLVNHIAGEQNFVRMAMSKRSHYDYDFCDLRLLAEEDNGLSLSLTGDMDFTAFQFEVDVPEGIDISAMRINSLRKDGHQLLFNKVADNCYRVVALSMTNAVFKGNDGELLNISLEGMGTDDIYIHDIHFVTTNGTDVLFDNLYINGNTTGMAGIHVKENAHIYDLQGRRHSTLQRGTNIVGNKKIVIK